MLGVLPNYFRQTIAYKTGLQLLEMGKHLNLSEYASDFLQRVLLADYLDPTVFITTEENICLG